MGEWYAEQTTFGDALGSEEDVDRHVCHYFVIVCLKALRQLHYSCVFRFHTHYSCVCFTLTTPVCVSHSLTPVRPTVRCRCTCTSLCACICVRARVLHACTRVASVHASVHACVPSLHASTTEWVGGRERESERERERERERDGGREGERE